MTRFALLVGAALAASSAWSAADGNLEQQEVERWRVARVQELVSEDGWLTLVGLYWLDPGRNSFGRAADNHLVLDHPALSEHAGTFEPNTQGAHFRAAAGGGITHGGQPVTDIDMLADTRGAATVLASGSLRLFIIERAGKMAVRVRDIDSPRRRQFVPIQYYPIEPAWSLAARFEPYSPHRRLKIVNILGMEQEMDSPGALVFETGGREWRLDAILEQPTDDTFFVMFADATNGKGSYGGGRFLRVPLPRVEQSGALPTTVIDFNKAYNPPCAFNDFATCPLPPYQNRLALRIESGEKDYAGGHPDTH